MSAPAIAESRALRNTLGRYATGVAVVTVIHRTLPTALTINSFTSVSLEPPLILWCIRHSSSRSQAMTTASHFAVNFLADDQRELAVQFSAPSVPWSDSRWRAGPYGLPILSGTAGHLICKRERLIIAGDHLILLGEILDHHATPRPPLLFLDGRFRTLERESRASEQSGP